MPKRETYSGALRCDCGAKGTGQYEENAHPVYAGGLDVEVLSVSKGFTIKNNTVFCDKCDKKI